METRGCEIQTFQDFGKCKTSFSSNNGLAQVLAVHGFPWELQLKLKEITILDILKVAKEVPWISLGNLWNA